MNAVNLSAGQVKLARQWRIICAVVVGFAVLGFVLQCVDISRRQTVLASVRHELEDINLDRIANQSTSEARRARLTGLRAQLSALRADNGLRSGAWVALGSAFVLALAAGAMKRRGQW